VWMMRNKIDLNAVATEAARPGIDAGNPRPLADSAQGWGRTDFAISASRGDGIRELMAGLIGFARDYFGSGEDGLIGRERQRKLLQQTVGLLQRSILAMDEGEEFAAEELRAAGQALGRLVGQVDVEDILDAIFRDFCIGK